MSIQFRRACADDAAVIADFNCRLAQETEHRVLEPDLVLAGVCSGLRLEPEVQYFVAERDAVEHRHVIGQVMCTREWSDWRNAWMIWIQSVYVRKDARQSGVFRGLLEFAVQQVSSNCNPACVRLYVEHANQDAKLVYSKLGFTASGYDVMERVLSAKA